MWAKSLTASLVVSFGAAYALNTDVAVSTPMGGLLGATTGTGESRVYVFKGIPYAVPPVGARRWKPATPHPGWRGDRLATHHGPECMQPTNDPSLFYRPGPQMSEDCLYLNVWTPRLEKENLPVMLWLHGGGLVYGAGSYALYDGSELARKGVVVVTINYRLNIFGYFAHPELSAESINDASGNYGTTDQIQALQWVQENIAAFGGDPGNITVFGESAGAQSISHLLASPLAEGLFQKAIMQSGVLQPIPALRQRKFGKLSAEETGASFASELGLENLSSLRALPAHELLQAFEDQDFATEAVEDDWVLPEQVIDVFENGRQQDVPILAGFNSGEGSSYFYGRTAPIPESSDSYVAAVKARYVDLADEYLAVYPATSPREGFYSAIRDGRYGWATESFVQAGSKGLSPAYLYYFDHVLPWAAAREMGAYHTAEIPFAFNNVRHTLKYSPRWPDHSPRTSDLALADVLSNYWIAFATTGTPEVEGQPEWQPYTDRKQHHMLFRNGKAQLSHDLHPGTWELHEKIYEERLARESAWGPSDIGLLAPEIR